MRKVARVAHIGDKRVVYKVLVRKPEGKGPLGRPRHRRKDNINLIFNKWEGMDWTDLAKDREKWWTLVNVIMNLRVA
jgi:hypothetical protein